MKKVCRLEMGLIIVLEVVIPGVVVIKCLSDKYHRHRKKKQQWLQDKYKSEQDIQSNLLFNLTDLSKHNIAFVF